MINKYDAIDWQTFSQKKNIEEIAKNTKDKNEIQLTAVVEIFMTIATIVADNVLSGALHAKVWILILVISIIPVIRLFSKLIIRFWRKKQPGSDIPNSQDMIDLFDNDICYYVLMAESYSKEFNDAKKLKKECITETDIFYFIETCFYVNKAIYNLSKTANNFNAIYSDDVDELYNNRKISITRLFNLLDILDSVIKIVEDNFDIISDVDQKNNFRELFGKYCSSYGTFKKLLKK